MQHRWQLSKFGVPLRILQAIALLAEVSRSRDAGGLGFRSVVINPRGCGDVPLRTPRMSGGGPEDLRSALLFIRQQYPHAPLYGVGFSLGAIILTKYLVQLGAASEIRAVCVLACVSMF